MVIERLRFFKVSTVPSVSQWSNDGLGGIYESGSINLSTSPFRPAIIRRKRAIQKIKTELNQRKMVSFQELIRKLDVSGTGGRRMRKNDEKFRPIKHKVDQRSLISI